MDDSDHPLPILLVLLASLAGALALRRRGFGAFDDPPPSPRGTARAWAVVFGLTALASTPLAFGLPSFLRRDALLPGDAASHAAVAAAIARQGLPHGWVETYNAGFPFGPHYQPLPILLLAAIIKLGVPATAATNGAGLLAAILVPLLFVALARGLGARPLAALAGALLLAYVAPFQVFLGGPRAYASQGLFSQVVAMPIVLLTAATILRDRPRGLAPLLAAVAAASHAQLTVAAFLVGGVALVASGSRPVLVRYARAALAAGATSIAVYGPGARTFAIPFAWPRVPEFVVWGYGPERLASWILDGKLLDNGRPPILTALTVAALILLAARPRSARARAAAALLIASIALSIAGHELATASAAGRSIVEIFSPVRLLCFVVPAAAVALTVAVDALADFARGGLRLPITALPAAIAATFLAVPTASWAFARIRVEEQERAAACHVDGYDAGLVRSWVASLERGRFVVDEDAFPSSCPVLHGVELAAHLPFGGGKAGPGSQLGVSQRAFDDLHPSAPGGADRAELLGVRFVLGRVSRPLAPTATWRATEQRGDVALYERVGGGDRVGFGCVGARWRGPDRALRDALFEAIDRAELSPARLIALDHAAAPLTREEVSIDGCDAAGATARDAPREPGAIEASIHAPSPVDVVIRETAFPTWSVLVDGRPAPTFEVAPGFFAVRVEAGDHRLEARVAPPRGYGLGVVAALLLAIGLVWSARRPPSPGASRVTRLW